MPSIQDTIYNDLRIALKEKKEPELSTLRLLKTEIQYELTKSGSSEISDVAMIPILKKNISQRQDSSQEYKKAGRDDLSEKELLESEIILKYLPKEVSQEEIDSVVDEAIQQLKPRGPQDTGKVMGKAMLAFKGKNIDGAKVSETVKKSLQALA